MGELNELQPLLLIVALLRLNTPYLFLTKDSCRVLNYSR